MRLLLPKNELPLYKVYINKFHFDQIKKRRQKYTCGVVYLILQLNKSEGIYLIVLYRPHHILIVREMGCIKRIFISKWIA